ncbi:hypothetical protein DFH28DRAFT_835426, partial [Melampsora americana]
LYCDDLSGNVSKRWNKHIAFYFTLAGLPSKLSNQEYNCHFLSTSNTAGALELAYPLIDELNNLMTEGFVAYDENIQKEVFVMTVVLCHLGDSCMHAEVTNTMNPTTSLTPCQICNLKVQSLMDKRSSRYICDFLGIDETGNKSSLQKRDWAKTVQGTKDLWNLAQRPGNISQFDTKSAELGLRDSLNMSFVKMVQDFYRDQSISHKRLFNPFSQLKGFDGHCDTPAEVLHVILLGVGKYLMRNQMNSCSGSKKDSIQGRWRSFNTSGLNIPPIQPKTMIQHFMSLNGKEFRAVLQAAPFIFFELNISAEEHATWIALAHLSLYIFWTEITNIDLYLCELACLIKIFLKSIVELTAQWCNKPKFHMLIHLAESIQEFGPACLIDTENFEGYNGNTQQSSIKSNNISPGKDIANSFNNHRLIRAITAGAKIYDCNAKTYIQASSKVQDIFRNNTLFQKALGFNSSLNHENPIMIGTNQPTNPSMIIPRHIFESYTAKDWKVLSAITLPNKQKVSVNTFLLVKNTQSLSGKRIVRVQNIWGV